MSVVRTYSRWAFLIPDQYMIYRREDEAYANWTYTPWNRSLRKWVFIGSPSDATSISLSFEAISLRVYRHLLPRNRGRVTEGYIHMSGRRKGTLGSLPFFHPLFVTSSGTAYSRDQVATTVPSFFCPGPIQQPSRTLAQGQSTAVFVANSGKLFD
jgi:hypothetical protein